MTSLEWCEATAKVVAESVGGVFHAMPENDPDRPAALRCLDVAEKAISEFEGHAAATPKAQLWAFEAGQCRHWIGRIRESLAPEFYSYDVQAVNEARGLYYSVKELIECGLDTQRAERPYWTALPTPE
jgi:hypothetical protein